MYSVCRWLRLLTLAVMIAGSLLATELRVCADPNNLPFSNQQQQGFDNEIAQLLAHDLGRTISYFWSPERGDSFVSKTLLAKKCDVLMGIPSTFIEAHPSRPYYRSTYVFLWRRDRHLRIQSLNDPALRKYRIGVHVVSDDAANLPPAQALANRGMFGNMAAYSIYGNLARRNPPAALIEAVERGDVDLAIAWGPLAGYFAKHSSTPLEIEPVSPEVDRPFLPFTFSISIGTRPEDKELSKTLDEFIERRRVEIHRILERYGVPTLDGDLRAENRP